MPTEAKLLELFELLDSCPTHAIPPGELSVAVVNESTICRLHEEFLDDPSPTDVITFPGDPEVNFAGEIVVSYDQALREYARHRSTLAGELLLYLVHGWLHLAGEDDSTEDARLRMRAAEASVIKWLEDLGFKF